MKLDKVKIEREEIFSITIGDKKHCGFKKVSDWEDMIKFTKGNSGIIVHRGTGLGLDLGDIFEAILGGGDDKYPKKCDVVSLSPSLVPIEEKSEELNDEEHY